jgi:aryl-alcohol dehydrogenase-like predicted oxidoreductase
LSIVMIGNWGRNKEGVYTYSINTTTRDEIYEMLAAAREMGWRFFDTPNIVKKHKTFHVLLKIYKPAEMGYPDES